MISKELLGEVLSTKIHSIEPIIINEISFTTVSQHLNRDLTKPKYTTVNLDTLGRLIKEQSVTKGIYIFSGKVGTFMYPWEAYVAGYENKFWGNTELEAIIEAYQCVKRTTDET